MQALGDTLATAADTPDDPLCRFPDLWRPSAGADRALRHTVARDPVALLALPGRHPDWLITRAEDEEQDRAAAELAGRILGDFDPPKAP